MAEESPQPPNPNPIDAAAAPQAAAPGAEVSAVPQPDPVTSPADEATSAEASVNPAAAVDLDASDLDQASIDELLKQASFDAPDTPEIDADAAMPGADAAEFKLPSFQQVIADAQVSSIDLLRDVDLNVKIELGRARMLVEDVLRLSEGSVVELDKLAGDPVDVFVNDRLVARGEVLVLNDNFCVRVNEIVAGIKDEGT
jgi:flagellar motor switch protein FliN/FliY